LLSVLLHTLPCPPTSSSLVWGPVDTVNAAINERDADLTVGHICGSSRTRPFTCRKDTRSITNSSIIGGGGAAISRLRNCRLERGPGEGRSMRRRRRTMRRQQQQQQQEHEKQEWQDQRR
jgi:hypothetical protein